MYNHCVRKLIDDDRIVSIAGIGGLNGGGFNGDDQLATHAKLHFPTSVVVSSSNQVYISDC